MQSIQRQLADTVAARPVGAEAEVRDLVLRLVPVVDQVLTTADASQLHELYGALRIHVRVDHEGRNVAVSALPHSDMPRLMRP